METKTLHIDHNGKVYDVLVKITYPDKEQDLLDADVKATIQGKELTVNPTESGMKVSPENHGVAPELLDKVLWMIYKDYE